MKVWILVFVVAVWTQLPAEGSAKNLGPALRSVPTNKLSEIAKVAKRDDSSSEEEDSVSWSSSEEDDDKDSEVLDFLTDSGEVADFLKKNFLLVDLIKESVDEDEDIPEKDKMLARVRIILTIAGIDVDELDFLKMAEERAVEYRKKSVN